MSSVSLRYVFEFCNPTGMTSLDNPKYLLGEAFETSTLSLVSLAGE